MNGEIILYLENPDGDKYVIPLMEDYNVSLNLSFTDLQSFKVTGTYSNTFKCPFDQEAFDFFGAIFDNNYVGWFNPKNKIPAYITADTIPFSQGHVEVVDMIQNKKMLELSYYGETPDIKSSITTKLLSELTDLQTDLGHTIDYDNITDDNLLDGNVNYFLIDRGQNFSESNLPETQPIFNNSQPLYPSDFTPAVNARWIWDRIWSDAGFVVDSPTDFPDTLNDYWIPWYNGGESPISTEPPNGQNFRLNLLTAQEFVIPSNGSEYFDFSGEMSEAWDVGSNVVNNVFTAPFSGIFRFRIWGTFKRDPYDPGGVSPQVTMMLRNGSNQIKWSNDNVINVAHIPDGDGFFNSVKYVDVSLNAGEELKYTLYIVNNNASIDVLVNGTDSVDYQFGTGLEMYEVVSQFADYTVDMVQNAPEMRQYDFIQSIARMHNLIVVPDRNIPNKIRIEPMNDYLQSGDTVDWTPLLDLSKDVSIKPTTSIQARDIIFTYAEDGDALNKAYTDQLGRVFGTVDSTRTPLLNNLRSDFASGDNKTELQFAATPCNNIPGTNIPIPKFVNDKGENLKTKARILYHAFSVDDVQVYDDDTATVTDTTVRILSHFDNYDPANQEPGVDTLDLNFGAELRYLQYTEGAPLNNLFYRYWIDYIREIYDPSARMMTAHFALDITDFLTFDFSNVIWIKDSYWRVLEVDGYGVGVGTSTRVKLLKILTLSTDCEWIPFQTNQVGTVTFINQDGVTTGDGTEECCDLYGYTWVTGKCYWFVPQQGINPSGSGLNNIGVAGQNSNPLPKDSFATVSDSAISYGNFGAKFGGIGIESGHGNVGSIAHGRDLSIANDLGQVAVFGNNAEALHNGFHFGGGFNEVHGYFQFGDLPFMGDGTLTTIGDKIEIFLPESTRLVLPDETVWACTLKVVYSHFNVASNAIDKWGEQVYNFELHKANGVAGVTSTQIAPDHEDGNLTSHLELDFDVATDSTQHRLMIEAVSGSGLPSSDLKIGARLSYTQIKAINGIS